MSSLALAFTDDEIEVVLAAARPLAASDRDAFLQMVADELRNAGGEIGPGLVARICREVQPRFLRAVEIRAAGGTGKYR